MMGPFLQVKEVGMAGGQVFFDSGDKLYADGVYRGIAYEMDREVRSLEQVLPSQPTAGVLRASWGTHPPCWAWILLRYS